MTWGKLDPLDKIRYIYALVFSDGIYIGQTGNARVRERAHRSAGGGWFDRNFRFLILEQPYCSEYEAVRHEWAWRDLANKRGIKVYVDPSGKVLERFMDLRPSTQAIAAALVWPEALYPAKISGTT